MQLIRRAILYSPVLYGTRCSVPSIKDYPEIWFPNPPRRAGAEGSAADSAEGLAAADSAEAAAEAAEIQKEEVS